VELTIAAQPMLSRRRLSKSVAAATHQIGMLPTMITRARRCDESPENSPGTAPYSRNDAIQSIPFSGVELAVNEGRMQHPMHAKTKALEHQMAAHPCGHTTSDVKIPFSPEATGQRARAVAKQYVAVLWIARGWRA